MSKTSIALLLLVVPVIGLATPVWSTAIQTPSTVIAFDGALAYRHVVELAGNVGIRASGSPQEEQAARYIAQQMAALGYPVVMQTFPIFYWEKRSSALTVSFPASGALPRSIDHAVVAGSPSTPPQGLRAAVVHVGLGRPDDFRGKDLIGKVALIQRGDLFFGEKVTNAAVAGAVLAIIYNNEAGQPLPGDRIVGSKPPPMFEPLPIPGLFVTREEGQAILAEPSDGLQIQFSLSVLVESRSSRNVIATKASPSGRSIYISAHMDTVPTSPGANDNASGVAVLLELARSIKEWELDVTVRFIFSGAHETLSSGAEYYARTMSDDELKNALYMIDLDMVGWQEANVLLLVGIGEGRTCLEKPNAALAESRAAAVHWQDAGGGFYRAEGCASSPLDSSFFHGRGIATVRYKALWYDPNRDRAVDDPNHHLSTDDLSNVSPTTLGLAGAVLELTLASHRLQGR